MGFKNQANGLVNGFAKEDVFLDASVPELVAKLTTEEKVQLLAGRDWWR